MKLSDPGHFRALLQRDTMDAANRPGEIFGFALTVIYQHPDGSQSYRRWEGTDSCFALRGAELTGLLQSERAEKDAAEGGG